MVQTTKAILLWYKQPDTPYYVTNHQSCSTMVQTTKAIWPRVKKHHWPISPKPILRWIQEALSISFEPIIRWSQETLAHIIQANHTIESEGASSNNPNQSYDGVRRRWSIPCTRAIWSRVIGANTQVMDSGIRASCWAFTGTYLFGTPSNLRCSWIHWVKTLQSPLHTQSVTLR